MFTTPNISAQDKAARFIILLLLFTSLVANNQIRADSIATVPTLRMTSQNNVISIENPAHGMWPNDRIRFSELMSIGNIETDSKTLFHQVKAIDISRNGRIFILDSGNQRIAVFNRRGNYLYEFGRFGEGPGEFNDPSDIAIDLSGNILVLDRGSRRIITFDRDGKYLRTTPLKNSAAYMDFLSEDLVLLSGSKSGMFGAFGDVFDLSREQIIRQFSQVFMDFSQKSRSSFSLGEHYQSLRDGRIYLAVPFPCEIQIYSREGRLLTRIKKKDSRVSPPTITFPKGSAGVSVMESGCFGPCFRTAKGYLLNNYYYLSRKEEDVKIQTGIDIYDLEGRFLTSLEFLNGGKLLAVDDQDLLYLLENEPVERIIVGRLIGFDNDQNESPAIKRKLSLAWLQGKLLTYHLSEIIGEIRNHPHDQPRHIPQRSDNEKY